MSITTNNTNEPNKLYSSLSHEQMRGNMRITWKSEIEDKLYQFCGQEGITAKSVPNAQQCVDLMRFIGFDTEDTDVYKNALTKVVTWISNHMCSAKLSGLVKEVFEPGKKLAPADVSVHTWMTTWRSTGYSPTKDGFDVPVDAAQQSWTPVRRVTPVGQPAVVSQGCALRFAGKFVSTSATAPTAPFLTTSTSVPIVMPTTADPAAAPVVKILPSKFHTDMIEVFSQQAGGSKADEVSEWLNMNGAKVIGGLVAQAKAASATASKMQNLSSLVAALKDEAKKSQDEAKKSNDRVAALDNEVLHLNNRIHEIRGDAKHLNATWEQRDEQSMEMIKQRDDEIRELKARIESLVKESKHEPPSPPATPVRGPIRDRESVTAPRGQRVRFAFEEDDFERDLRARNGPNQQQAPPNPSIDDIMRSRLGMPQGDNDYPVLPTITDMEDELRQFGVEI